MVQSLEKEISSSAELQNIHQPSILVPYSLVRVLSGAVGVFLKGRTESACPRYLWYVAFNELGHISILKDSSPEAEDDQYIPPLPTLDCCHLHGLRYPENGNLNAAEKAPPSQLAPPRARRIFQAFTHSLLVGTWNPEGQGHFMSLSVVHISSIVIFSQAVNSSCKPVVDTTLLVMSI